MSFSRVWWTLFGIVAFIAFMLFTPIGWLLIAVWLIILFVTLIRIVVRAVREIREEDRRERAIAERIREIREEDPRDKGKS